MPESSKRLQRPYRRLNAVLRELREQEVVDEARIRELVAALQPKPWRGSDEVALRESPVLPGPVWDEIQKIRSDMDARRKTVEHGLASKARDPKRWKKALK